MSRSDLLNPKRKLPDTDLQTADGVAARVRAPGDRATLLALVHADCDPCRSFLGRLAGQRQEVATWKGEVRVVASDALRAGDDPFPRLIDSEGKLATALGVRAPAVVIADQWGEIHEAAEAGKEHRFLPIEAIVEWVRHLATQCPECEGEAL